MTLNDEFNDIISQCFQTLNLPTSPRGLYEPITYTLRSGGKRIRPLLLLAAVKAFKRKPEIALNQCIGLEMFHNFTLIHDDVMDNSEVRRGQPTVHKKWNNNTAILSGDTMLTLATEYISKCSEQHLRRVLDLFNRTAIEVYEGQQMDMDFESETIVSIEDYLEMIRLKTSVLLACSLKMGAIIADADAEESDALYRYGISLGLGFQLRDDYLDTFGDPLIFGKQIGGDILNNKKTWLMITALSEDTTDTITQAINGAYSSAEKIERVTAVYRQLHLDERILSLIKNYSDEAIRIVNSIDIDKNVRNYFVELAKSMVDRMN